MKPANVDRVLFLEQRVLADLGEVVVDGLLGHIEVVLGLHPRRGFASPACVDDHGGGDRDQGNANQSGRDRVCQGSMSTEPSAKALESTLAVRRRGLVGKPVLEDMSQVTYRLVSRRSVPAPSPSGRSLPAERVLRGQTRRLEVSLQDFFDDLGNMLTRKRDFARQQFVKGRAGCKRRWRGQAGRCRPGPVPGSYDGVPIVVPCGSGPTH